MKEIFTPGLAVGEANNHIKPIEGKSHCCNADVEFIKGGQGVFGLTVDSQTCSKCEKFCCRLKIS
jgi:hypothetical protein